MLTDIVGETRGLQTKGRGYSENSYKRSRFLTHLESFPFPLTLLHSDIHVPQNRLFILIRRTRKRVTPGINQARPFPTAIELAIENIKEDDGKGTQEKSDKYG